MNIKLLIKKILTKNLINHKLNNINYLKVCLNNNLKYGHYQINGLLTFAKKNKYNYETIYMFINNDIQLNLISEKIFLCNNIINIKLRNIWLLKLINYVINYKQLIFKKNNTHRIILDYASPNLAKELHIGNMRSMIIGDAMANAFSYMGYDVIKINHVGDWGTPIAMIISYIIFYNININNILNIKLINNFYKKSNFLYKIKHPVFYKFTKQCLISLQKKNKNIISLWKKLIDVSLQDNQLIYNIYNINLNNNNIIPESFYSDYLEDIVYDLINKKLALFSNSAILTNLDNISSKELEIKNLLIRKTDGTFLYATTDIAALKYRVNKFKPHKIIFYIDVRQKQYLQHIFMLTKQAGYVPTKTVLLHHNFGMILDKQLKPLKSRDGENISLKDLLILSKKKIINFIKQKYINNNLLNNQTFITNLAVGSIKYSELSRHREFNYIFDWNKLINLEGNTFLYIQYAYCRMNSIIFKIKDLLINNEIKMEYLSEVEKELIFLILRYEETLNLMKKKGYPHILCQYLYRITKKFTYFYEKYNVLTEPNKTIFSQRIQIIYLLRYIIKNSMKIFGIKLALHM